jgi:hypothetical protein
MAKLKFTKSGVYTTAETMFGEVMIHERLFAGSVKFVAYGTDLSGEGVWFDSEKDAKSFLNRVYGNMAA